MTTGRNVCFAMAESDVDMGTDAKRAIATSRHENATWVTMGDEPISTYPKHTLEHYLCIRKSYIST